MELDLTTRASPEQVLRAMTDFSERRPEIWSRTLDAGGYELRELGETWAIARESTGGSPFWVVTRYDWSDPHLVRWTDVETSWGGLGAGSLAIEPHGDGGSRLHAEWSSGHARRRRDRVLLWLLHRGPMHRMISRMWATTLDRYADAEGS